MELRRRLAGMMNQLDVRSLLVSLTFEAYILSDLPISSSMFQSKLLFFLSFVCELYHMFWEDKNTTFRLEISSELTYRGTFFILTIF